MNEDIVAIIATFGTIIIVAIGFPLVRSWTRRKEMEMQRTPVDPEMGRRLERIEHAIETMAVEVERISEGQRFVTKLLSDRARVPAELPSAKQ